MSEAAIAEEVTTTDPVVEELARPTEAEADATPSPESGTEPSPVADTASLLKEIGFDDGAEATATGNGEKGDDAEAQDAWLEKLPEDVKGKVEELVEQVKTREQAEQLSRVEGRRKAFQGRTVAIETFLTQRGLSLEDAKRVSATFNAHHSDSIVFAQQEVANNWIDSLYGEMAKQLPTSERETFKSKERGALAEVVTDFKETARKGYVPERELKTAKQTGRQELLDKLLTDDAAFNALASKRKAPAVSVGGGTGGRSDDDLLMDPATPSETVRQILARRNGQ